MNDGHMRGMGNMAPTSSSVNGTRMPNMRRHKMLMHMTFFWGKNALILFTGWPGTSSGMYALALMFVFVMAVLVEWLSHCNLIRNGSNHVAAGLIQTLMYAVRVGLAYLMMLALMSFNGGVFLVAVAGHALGFLFFGTTSTVMSSSLGSTACHVITGSTTRHVSSPIIYHVITLVHVILPRQLSSHHRVHYPPHHLPRHHSGPRHLATSAATSSHGPLPATSSTLSSAMSSQGPRHH
ncbi:hypothetical protein F0562_001015 [Nyssa sinensis]|uniref:Copper transport protein n=1 Tax=Nyssa sinensis TaxID=561372 RepID=A0A5J5C6T4_9ASTE|nr:hypothetical protein F0562_001015 [Nyssa sinensis]